MSPPLLKTKLYIPSTGAELVSRPRLVERLAEGVRQGCRLVLISAPAGYGKTTLLSEWIAQDELQECVGWLSLDEGDNDPARFWPYFAAALQSVREDIEGIDLLAFQPTPARSIDALLIRLLNQVAEAPDPITIVLDDYHKIDHRDVHEGVSFVLENMPPNMHVVIATRVDPPLPIPRLRGRGQLVEVYEADLRFSLDEAAQFLNQVMGLELSADDVAALEKRTEGWIAGLQMAALSMRGRDDHRAFVQAFTGSHRYVLDYLSGEVLRQQRPQVRQFLLQTAILERLTAPLCSAVVDGAVFDEDLPDSQAMLAHLERSNLFVVPLDDERSWYRYHRLFADLLVQQVEREQPALVLELHRRASEWYEDERMMGEAIDHALAATDYERAARLLERVGWEMLARGACTTLLRWLNTLPETLVGSRPQFGVFRAWCLAVMGRVDDAESYLADHDLRPMRAEMGAVQAYASSVRGDVRHAIAFAQQALEQLPEENVFIRGFLALNLGIAYASRGEPDAASQALNQAVELSRATGFTDLTVAALGTLGHVQHNQARLHEGLETHRDVLDLAQRAGIPDAPVVGMAHLGIGEVLYEWNELGAAADHVTEGMKLLEQGRFMTYLLFGHSLRAQLCRAEGDLSGAQTALQEAEQLAQGGDYAYMTAVLEGLGARLDLARGDLEAAGRWARENQWTSAEELDHAREVEQTAVARVLVAQDRPSEALRLLEQLLEGAKAAGRMGSVIKISALRSLTFDAQDDVDGALAALEQALSLGEREGYVRTFLDEGKPMARLLRQALLEGIAPNYVARLLAAFGEEAEVTSRATESLIEPLTERELEVLRLIVAGLSNPEIAEELFIAVSTVKSHVNHIYGKLGVGNRVEAVTTAQELDLL